MSTLRGLHVITDLSIGGAQQALTRFVASRAWKGDRWHVVSLVSDGAFGARLRDAGAEVTSLGMRPGRLSLAGWRTLRAVVDTWAPSVVLTWLYHADLLGTLAWWRHPVPRPPLAWCLRASDMDMAHYRWQSRVTRALCARGSFVPDAIIANSWAGRRAHEALGYRARRWIDCPNGLDLDWFRPDAALRAQGRRALGVTDGDVVIGLVARVDPMKDHHTFVEAARLLARRVPHARFLAVGTGATSSPLLAAAAADPELDGRLIRREAFDDLRPVYAALDIATLTSAFGEGFPNVVAEAMACGVPVVSTNVGDAARIVGETGSVVAIGDRDGLAAAWEALAGSDPARRLALGQAARQRIANEFSLEDVAGRFRTHLEALSAAGRGRPAARS